MLHKVSASGLTIKTHGS